ncbi:hypothetical protein E8P82_07335 [Arthrobacter echini]|uniref:Ava_C0101 and related proteins n=1 Tax=Arthrobacter echini TaxID=1529066 RepID=A0A4S5E5E0_9MICC|nr:DUF5996 family protein [Arthrobacter echini]THJ66745.1 hypothetical protein E8P82_07335 [Arthrobacter echini]
MEQQQKAQAWPELRVEDWTETRDTLHLWTQIVGKIRMAHAPMLNHWWQVALYVTPRGLTTSAIPYGNRTFDIEFDFLDHELHVRDNDGAQRTIALAPMTVADFHARLFRALDELELDTRIQPTPNEVEIAIPFAEDTEHASYDPAAVQAFWQQLVQADRLMKKFRASFTGKVSPVHLFWGSFDMACTRFSGRTAPTHPGGAPNCADWVMEEGYSHELSSCGFWPGGGEEGAFYSYAYPEPEGFADYPVGPSSAFFSEEFQQFLLPYEAVRTSSDPDRMVLEFLQTTYEAAAERGHWDRAELEAEPDRWSHRRR